MFPEQRLYTAALLGATSTEPIIAIEDIATIKAARAIEVKDATNAWHLEFKKVTEAIHSPPIPEEKDEHTVIPSKFEADFSKFKNSIRVALEELKGEQLTLHQYDFYNYLVNNLENIIKLVKQLKPQTRLTDFIFLQTVLSDIGINIEVVDKSFFPSNEDRVNYHPEVLIHLDKFIIIAV